MKAKHQEVHFNGFKMTSVHNVHASARTLARRTQNCSIECPGRY